MILDVLSDALLDTLKVLPFLFAAFLILEFIEHYSSRHNSRILSKVGKAGPLAGALLGCIPQCGSSVAAANLYAGGLITTGTLLAVFLSTSDEALLILMAHPGSGRSIASLLVWKIIIGIIAGVLADLIFRGKKEEKDCKDICKSCGCSDTGGILKPALFHTVRLTAWLFLFTFCLNLLLAFIGIEKLAVFLGKDTLFQPFLAALLGLVPNCAASVLITELYLAGALSFGSAIAGLCSGAGVGLAVLFRSNHPLRENLKILLLLYSVAVIAGMLL